MAEKHDLEDSDLRSVTGAAGRQQFGDRHEVETDPDPGDSKAGDDLEPNGGLPAGPGGAGSGT